MATREPQGPLVMTTRKELDLKAQRIVNKLVVDEHILIALLKRCGHEIGDDAEIEWCVKSAVIKWSTAVI